MFLRLSPDFADTSISTDPDRAAFIVAAANSGNGPTIDFTIAAIPEPSAGLLMGFGILAIARRRQRN